MPDLPHEGGQTVGIYKKDADQVSLKNLPPCEEPGPGNSLNKDRVVDFSYTSDALAEMIVEAWTDEAYRTKLLNKEDAKELLAQRGFYLENPIVITEDQFNKHYRQEDDREIVFVLPDVTRVTRREQGQSLLETARLLMAITPNGI